MIQEAREQWEHDTDSAVLTQTLRVHCYGFLDEDIHLRSRPIQSISSIKYLDENNVQQTLATSIYELDKPERRVVLAYDQVWPATLYRWNSVEIDYVAGYASVSAVPAIAKRAMLLLIGRYFEDRDMMMGDAYNSLAVYQSLVNRYQRSTYP